MVSWFWQGSPQYSGRNTHTCNKQGETIWYLHAEGWTWHFPHVILHNWLKVEHTTKCTNWNYKSQRNTEINLCDLRLGSRFDLTSKMCTTKKETRNWTLLELKTFVHGGTSLQQFCSWVCIWRDMRQATRKTPAHPGLLQHCSQ